jgi:hypothetical protein
MERSLVAKAVAGLPVMMGHPIRRVRVPSLSANFNGQPNVNLPIVTDFNIMVLEI